MLSRSLMVLMVIAPCALGQEESRLSLSAGVHYSQGDYGTTSTTEVSALTATLRYERGPWTARATLPYLHVSGGATVIPGMGRVRDRVVPESTEHGPGDATGSLTYAAYYDPAERVGVDVTGKLKLATADQEKRLGTGENDLALQVEAYRSIERWTVLAALGYTLFGSSPDFPLRDGFNYGASASYRIDERDVAGVSVEGRQRVTPQGEPLRELTAFLSRRLGPVRTAQMYFLLGMSDAAPDWGAGVTLGYWF